MRAKLRAKSETQIAADAQQRQSPGRGAHALPSPRLRVSVTMNSTSPQARLGTACPAEENYRSKWQWRQRTVQLRVLGQRGRVRAGMRRLLCGR
jgi:hypothetical protein